MECRNQDETETFERLSPDRDISDQDYIHDTMQ